MSKITKEVMRELFKLPLIYTQEDLHAALVSLLQEHFKDKTIKANSSPKFKMFMEFYQKLLEDAQYTKTAASHSSQSRFDVASFNALFSKNHVPDSFTQGYKDWAVNESSFNEKSKHSSEQVNNPSPFMSGGDDIPCYELGVKKIKDYSAQNTSSLHFSDYKLAHTTEKIIDPTCVRNRKEYKNITELEIDRANISHTMTKAELALYTKRQNEEAKLERKRLALIKERDISASNHYTKLTQDPLILQLKKLAI